MDEGMAIRSFLIGVREAGRQSKGISKQDLDTGG